MTTDKTGWEGAEVWIKFWREMMSKTPAAMMDAMSPSASTPSTPSEFAQRMQTTFMEAWAKYMDEFMRSEAFLEMMKRSLEGALAFRQQLDQFMGKVLHGAQIPSRSDASDIMLFLHNFEDRVMDRIDDLSRRVAALETPGDPGAQKTAKSASSSSTKENRGA